MSKTEKNDLRMNDADRARVQRSRRDDRAPAVDKPSPMQRRVTRKQLSEEEAREVVLACLKYLGPEAAASFGKEHESCQSVENYQLVEMLLFSDQQGQGRKEDIAYDILMEHYRAEAEMRRQNAERLSKRLRNPERFLDLHAEFEKEERKEYEREARERARKMVVEVRRFLDECLDVNHECRNGAPAGS